MSKIYFLIISILTLACIAQAQFININTSKKFPIVNELNNHLPFAPAPPTIPLKELGKNLSSIVRIESRSFSDKGIELIRIGTGSIIATLNHSSDSTNKEVNLLILTAYHVLYDTGDSRFRKVSLFTEDRKYFDNFEYEIIHVLSADDLALIQIRVPIQIGQAILLPKLCLCEVEKYSNATWAPRYFRINPGTFNQEDLSFNELTPRLSSNMTTKDGVNSLALFTQSFWSIPSDFSPGMSGGPVFASNIQGSNSIDTENINESLVGVMGYIFDKETNFGYAYPFSQSDFENLISYKNYSSFQELNLRESSFEFVGLDLEMKSFGNSFITSVNKKFAPDYSIADELELTIPIQNIHLEANLPFNNGSITFKQLNDYINDSDHSDVLKRLRKVLYGDSSPSGSILSIKSGTPGAGGPVDGSPGGGGPVDGSPGSGGPVDGSPGGKNPTKKSEESRLKPSPHIIIFLKTTWNSPSTSYLLDSIELNNKHFTNITFLKDLLPYFKPQSKIRLHLKPLKLDPLNTKSFRGHLDLNPIKSDALPLSTMGEFVYLSPGFKGQIISTSAGLTLNIKTLFRDTKIGKTHEFSIRLGLITLKSQVLEAAIQEFRIDDKVVDLSLHIEYRLENQKLIATLKNQILFEVDL